MTIRDAVLVVSGLVATVGAALLVATAGWIATGGEGFARPDPFVQAFAIVTILALVVFASATELEDDGPEE